MAARSPGGRCPICERGRPHDVIADLNAIWVTAEREAALPGYVCLVAKHHVTEPFELGPEDRHAFWDEVSAVAEAVKRATASTKLNYEIHGNTIPHLHLHLYPRYPGDPFEGRPIDPARSPKFIRSDDELARLADAAAGRSPRDNRDMPVGSRHPAGRPGRAHVRSAEAD